MDRLTAEAPNFGITFGRIKCSFRGANFLRQQLGNGGGKGNVCILRLNEKIQWCGLAINTKTLSMTVDYKRYRNRQQQCHSSMRNVAIPPRLNPSAYPDWICEAIKRAAKGKFIALRECNRVWTAARRRALRRGFCHFVYTHYLINFVRQLGLDRHDRSVRRFIHRMCYWILSGFCSKLRPLTI